MNHEKLERMKEKAWTLHIPRVEAHLAFLLEEIQKLEESLPRLAGERLLVAGGHLRYLKEDLAKTEAELELRIQSQVTYTRIVNIAQDAMKTGRFPPREIVQVLDDVDLVTTKMDRSYTEQSKLMMQSIRHKWPQGNITAQNRLLRRVAPWFFRRWFIMKPRFLVGMATLRLIRAVIKKKVH